MKTQKLQAVVCYLMRRSLHGSALDSAERTVNVSVDSQVEFFVLNFIHSSVWNSVNSSVGNFVEDSVVLLQRSET